MRLRDTHEFQWGESFERALSRYLQERGWGILPVYNYSGGDDRPPLLEIVCENTLAAGVVLPDMLAAKEGHSSWIEAKRKTSGNYTRLLHRWETGFSLRLYKHYMSIGEGSGLPVYVFFGHDAEDEVRWTRLGELTPRIYEGPRMGPHGMVFFPWAALHFLCPMGDVLACLEALR